jgi:hypothetical protein
MNSLYRAALVGALLPANLFAAGIVTVITSRDAHPLESRAAGWIAEAVTVAVDAEVRIATHQTPGDGEGTRIMVGVGKSSTGTPHGEHRVVARDNEFIVEGDSPSAVLWAAAELVGHLGVRPTLQGDLPPIAKLEKIPPFQVTRSPLVSERVWDGIHAGHHSLSAWPVEALQKLFHQLAKLKFTHVVLPRAPASFAPIRVTGDTAGRSAFKGVPFFTPPDPDGYAQASRAAANDAGLVVLDSVEKDTSWVALGPGNASILPSLSLSDLEGQVRSVLGKKETRVTFFGGMPGDLNAAIYFASRACFEPSLTARKALEELVTPICGEGVSDRLWMGFEHLATARTTLNALDARLGVPEANFLARHLDARGKPRAEMGRLKTLYAEAMNEMYRGNTRARGGARPFILYHAKRLEFAMHFTSAVEALATAGDAAARKQEDARAEASDAALEAVYNALSACADVARDPADLAVIATLNEFGYRPLNQTLR